MKPTNILLAAAWLLVPVAAAATAADYQVSEDDQQVRIVTPQLEAAVRGLQGALHHRGRSPRADDSRDRIRADLQTKRALLRSALKTENYEEAAILRDTIRTLEAQLGNSLKELRPSMQDHN